MPQNIDINGTPVSIVWENDSPSSPVETFMPGQARATARIRCAYDKRHEVIDACAGYSYVVRIGSKKVIKRVPPLEYPYHKGLFCVGATKVEGITPYGTYTAPPYRGLGSAKTVLPVFLVPKLGQPDFLDARIELAFQTLEFVPRPDSEVMSTADGWIGMPDEGDALQRGIKRYITRSGQDAGRLLSFPGNIMYYRRFGLPVPQSSATFFQFAQDLVYEWFDVPEDALPQDAWAKCGARVNTKLFDGYKAQTLLFKNYSTKHETSSFGIPQYRVRYVMRYLPNVDFQDSSLHRGHNWYPTVAPATLPPQEGGGANPLAGRLVYLEVCTRGSTGTVGDPPRPISPLNGDSFYPEADFRDLFRAKQV